MKDFYKFLKISILVYIIVCLTKKLFSFQENFSESCSSKCSDVNDELLSNPDPTSDTVSSDYIINYDVCTDDEQCSVYYKKEPDLVSGFASLPRCGFITNRDEPIFDVTTDDEIKCDDNDIELPDRILPKCTDETHTLVLNNPRIDDATITDFNEGDLTNVCKKPDIGICRCSGDSCEPGKCAVQELNLSLDGNNENICKGIVGDAASGPDDLQGCEFIESDQSTDSCEDITCDGLDVETCSFPCKWNEAVTCSDISDQSICDGMTDCNYEPSSCSISSDSQSNLLDGLSGSLTCRDPVGDAEISGITGGTIEECGICMSDGAQVDMANNVCINSCSNSNLSEDQCLNVSWTDPVIPAEWTLADNVWSESQCTNTAGEVLTDIQSEQDCVNAGNVWSESQCTNTAGEVLIDFQSEQECVNAGTCDNFGDENPTNDAECTALFSDSGVCESGGSTISGLTRDQCTPGTVIVREWTPYEIVLEDIDSSNCTSGEGTHSEGTCSGVGGQSAHCGDIESDKLINDSCDRKLCVPKGSYLDNWNKNRYSTTLTDKTGQANKNGYCTLKDNSYLNSLYNHNNKYDKGVKMFFENLCEKQNTEDPDADQRNHDVNFCEGIKTNDENHLLDWENLIPGARYSIHSIIITDDTITSYSIPKSSFGVAGHSSVDFTGDVDSDTDLETFQFQMKNVDGTTSFGIIGDDPASDGVTIKYVDRNQELRKQACSFIFPTDQNGDEEIYKCQPPGTSEVADLVDIEDELNLYYKCSKEDSSSGCDNPNNDFLYSESNPNTRKDKCEEISGCSYNVSGVCFGNTDSSEDVQCPDKYTRKRPSSDNDPHNGYISISDATDTTEEAKHELCCEPKSDFCEGNFESSNDIVCPSSFVNKGSDVIKSDGVENSGCCESEDEIYKPFFTLTIDDLLYNVMDDRVSYERKLKNDILNLFRENEFKKLDGEDQITETEFGTEDIEILRIKDGSVIVEYRVGGEDNTERLLDSYNQIIKENIHLPTLGKDTFGTDPGGSSEEIIIEEEVSDDTTDFFGISFKTSYLIMCAIITSILCSVSFGLLLSLSAIK